MEILLTGYTAFLTQEWIETAFPDDHVLTTHTKSEALLDTRVKTVTLDGKQLLAQINETYQFDRIVYFSEYLLPHGEQEGELDRLRWVLQACPCTRQACGRTAPSWCSLVCGRPPRSR